MPILLAMKKYLPLLTILFLLFLGALSYFFFCSPPVPTSVWYKCRWEDEHGKRLLESGQYLPPYTHDTENCLIEDESQDTLGKFSCGPKTTTIEESSTSGFGESKYRGYFLRRIWSIKDPNALQYEFGYRENSDAPETLFARRKVTPIPKAFTQVFQHGNVFLRIQCEAKDKS